MKNNNNLNYEINGLGITFNKTKKNFDNQKAKQNIQNVTDNN